MATDFKGSDGPNRGSPDEQKIVSGSTTTRKIYAISVREEPPSEPRPPIEESTVIQAIMSESSSRWVRLWPPTSGGSTGWSWRLLRFVALIGFVLLAVGMQRVGSGNSIYAAFHISTLYYALAVLLFIGGGYLFVFMPSSNKLWAVTMITVVGTAIAATAFVPHHPSKKLVLNLNGREIVRGAFRRISGTAPGAGYVTVSPVGEAGAVKRLHVKDGGEFSTAVRVNRPQETFAVKYFDRSGIADNPSDQTKLTVFTKMDRTDPAVTILPEPDGANWTAKDNSGSSIVDVRMRRPSGVLVATWRGFNAKNGARVHVVVPPLLVGVFKFCARAHDQAGNRSEPVCAWSRVGAPKQH